MLKPIFIVPFAEAWERPADFQRQTCLRLAKKYRVVALLEYRGVFWLTALIEWLTQTSPTPPKLNSTNLELSFSRPIYLLPGKRWPQIYQLNQQLWLWWLWLKSKSWLHNQKVWLWIFEPAFWFYPITVPFAKSLYDCVDDHTQTNSVENRQIKLQELKLIKTVDLFTTNSQTLAKLHHRVRQVDKVVAQGFDLILWPKNPPPQLKNPTNLAIFGSLDERIDWPLLKYLVGHLSNLTFNLAGPISSIVKSEVAQLINQPNVTYHGVLPRPKLKKLLNQAGVCLIPYLSHLTSVKNCFPMKILEYFAFGKPVIANRILELELYNQDLTLADTPTEWLAAIKTLITTPLSPAQRRHQRQVSWQHRYEKKISQILNLISHPAKKI